LRRLNQRLCTINHSQRVEDNAFHLQATDSSAEFCFFSQ
jgi:hypothetical protein